MKLDINKLGEENIYSLTLLLLSKMKDNKKYSTLSELIFVLDKGNFLSFIKYFGGLTITIPTEEEMLRSIQVLLLYQYRIIDKHTWEDSLKLSGFSRDEGRIAERHLTHFKSMIPEVNVKRT